VKSSVVSPARSAAFEILRRVEDGAFSSILLASLRDLQPVDRTLTHELVLGVLRYQLYLDSLIQRFSNRKLEKLDRGVVIALRLALYQLRFLDRIPDSAAVNESVNLVRRAKLRSAEGFVNAILRRATREPDYDPAHDTTDAIERLSILNSHPQWLVRRWVDKFGYEFAEAFFASKQHRRAHCFSRCDETSRRERSFGPTSF